MQSRFRNSSALTSTTNSNCPPKFLRRASRRHCAKSVCINQHLRLSSVASPFRAAKNERVALFTSINTLADDGPEALLGPNGNILDQGEEDVLGHGSQRKKSDRAGVLIHTPLTAALSALRCIHTWDASRCLIGVACIVPDDGGEPQKVTGLAPSFTRLLLRPSRFWNTSARPPEPQAPIKVTAEVKRKAWALRSVLKVFVTKVDPNYAQPWQMCPQRSSTGSAFVIDNVKRYILTNSHVISNATAVYVRRPGLAKKFKADVIADAKEDAFWDCDMKGLQIVDVPELQELDVSYELELKDHLVPMLHGVDCVPSYFIVGGLVFMPLTQPFLEMVFWGSGKRSRRGDIPVALLQALCANKEHPGQQVVILVQVLAHEINHGYKHTVVPCDTFNGEDIKNLRHLAGT
eukprot:gene24812-10459_t